MIDLATTKLLGYNIFSGSKEFFSGEFRGIVNTISPHSYIIARKDNLFKEALMDSAYIIPDGVGIVMAARFLNGNRIKKIAGSDLHEEIIKTLNKKNGSCFYLGSSETTLTLIRERLAREQPAVRIGTYSPPFRTQFTEEDNISILKMINKFNPDVLFVGMTAPKQEKWVYENKSSINAPVICSIGAVFDFYAGTVKRSGKLWIDLGLEWLPRLLREPVRLWRRNFISTPLFLLYIFYEKLKLLFVPLKLKKGLR